MRFFKLPDLGEGIPEADIVKWHVKTGDEVKEDQLLVSVETAKAVVDVPSPQDGVIGKLFGEPGETVHTGEPLVEFSGVQEDDTGTVVGKLEEATGSAVDEQFFVGASPSTAESQRTRATPAVRALAQRLGIDIAKVKPSSPAGNVTAEDVEKEAYTSPLGEEAETLRGVRKHMARNMAASGKSVVSVTLCDDADIHHWEKGADITVRVMMAIAMACQEEPSLNAWFDGITFSRRLFNNVHLGVAVDSSQGLFVPVMRDIGNRSAQHLRKGLNAMRRDVENRSVHQDELKGATITLSNFGTMAGRYATPIVVPPMVCILGTGVIREEPVAVDGKVEVHRIMPLSLSFDHRAATGGEAARFLAIIIQQLQTV